MTDRNHLSDEKQEIHEYEEAAKELEAARVLEEAEFIRELDEDNEPLEDVEDFEIQDAPVYLLTDEIARRRYWQAQGLVELEQGNFASALEKGDVTHQRNAYFRLAVYHGRTIYILRSVLNSGKQPLAIATMRNLATLHRAMMQMHKKAPHNIPVALLLDRQGRDDFARDLVMRALQESKAPLDLDRIVQRVNDLDVMGVARGTV